MKAVARLPAEPPGLATYRAAHPDDAAAEGTEAQAVWNRFRDSSAYRELRDELVKTQRGLCAYCEQRLTSPKGDLLPNDQQVEHVLAKAGGSGRALDWTNVVLCCMGGSYSERDPKYRDEARHYRGPENVSCGQAKGECELPPGCDPRGFPSSPRLVRVLVDGRLTVEAEACRAAGVDPAELDRAINDVLNLNCARLTSPRAKVVANVLEWWLPLALQLSERLTADQRAAMMQLVVANSIQPDSHGHLPAFWTATRQYLEPYSNTWVANNAALLGSAP